MKLLEKLKGTYKYILATALASTIATSSPTAQADFYEGNRGPSTAQLHYTANFAKDISHSLALKYFGQDVFIIGAINTNGEEINSGFIGLGFILETEYLKFIPVLGYAISTNGAIDANLILQGTHFLDKDGSLMLDITYKATASTDSLQQSISLTPSIGNPTFRIGPELTYNTNNGLSEKLILRYDLDSKSHSSWLEFAVNQQGNLEFQFRGNF